MHVEMRKSGDVVIVDLKGKLTAGLGDQILRESIDELLAEGWKKILLNLSEVSFLDSAGLGELVAGLGPPSASGRELKLLNVGGARAVHPLHVAAAARLRDLRGTRRKRSATFEPAPGPTRSTEVVAASVLVVPDRSTVIGSTLMILSSTEHSGQLMVSPTSSS